MIQLSIIYQLSIKKLHGEHMEEKMKGLLFNIYIIYYIYYIYINLLSLSK